MSCSINSRSSVEKKLSYASVTVDARRAQRTLSGLDCSVYNGSTRDQQMYDCPVTLLRRHMQGSAGILARVINSRSSVEKKLGY